MRLLLVIITLLLFFRPAACEVFLQPEDTRLDMNYPFPVVEPPKVDVARDGSGYVYIRTRVHAAARNQFLRMLVEYSTDGPDGPWYKCWLAEDRIIICQDNIPEIDNSNEYQVGSKVPIYVVMSGNTIIVVWDTRNKGNGKDISNASLDNVFVKLTFKYNNVDFKTQAAQLFRKSRSITGFAIDNASPEPTESLSFSKITWDNRLVLELGKHGFDRNFREYVVRYSEKMDVTEEDASFGREQDINLGYLDFNGAKTVSIEGLATNRRYYLNIWIYDTYGNSAKATETMIYMKDYGETKKKSEKYYLRGVKYFKEDNLEKALEEFGESLRILPGREDIQNYLEETKKRLSERYYNLGLNEFSRDNRDSALDYWEKALELNPGNRNAQNAFERYRR